MTALASVLQQTLPSGNLASVSSVAVPGGTLYLASVDNGQFAGENPAVVFVATTAVTPTRYMRLNDAASDAGLVFTGTPGSGAFGVARTAGTSYQLQGETTSSNAKTDKALFELSLPDSYVAGANVPVLVNVATTGAGTLTTASTTITVVAYTESAAGVEAALVVTAAQQFSGAAQTLTFTITGTSLVPAQHIVIEVVMLVTSSSGSNTGWLNSVAIQA